MTIGKLRTWLYRIAAWLGDYQAIRRGPKAIGQRLLRRQAGRMTGRLLGTFFRRGGLLVAMLVCTVTISAADDRRGSPFPTDEHWEGSRTWRPERQRGWRGQDLPDRFTIDKPGKCEVRCERIGREYKCREYRC